MVNYTQKAADYLINNARQGNTGTKEYSKILNFYKTRTDKDDSLLEKLSPVTAEQPQQFNPLQQAIAGDSPLGDIKITDKPSVDTPPLKMLSEMTGEFFRDFRATNPFMASLGLDYPAITEIGPTGKVSAIKSLVKPEIKVENTQLFARALKADKDTQTAFNNELQGFYTKQNPNQLLMFQEGMDLSQKMEILNKMDGRFLNFKSIKSPQPIEFITEDGLSFVESEKKKADEMMLMKNSPMQMLLAAMSTKGSPLEVKAFGQGLSLNVPILGDLAPYGSRTITNLLENVDDEIKGDPKTAAFFAREARLGKLFRRKLASRFTNIGQAGATGLTFLYGEGAELLKHGLNRIPQVEIDSFGGAETPEQREALLTRFFPNAAKDYEMYMKSRGIYGVSAAKANEILYFDQNIGERALGLAVEGAGPGSLLAKFTAFRSAKEGLKFQNYLKEHGKKFDTLDEATEGFIKNKHIVDEFGRPVGPRLRYFPTLREGFQRGRLSNAVQMFETTLPVNLRQEVKNAKLLRSTLATKIIAEKPVQGTQRHRDLFRQYRQANEKVAAAKAYSNVSPFLRELGKAEMRVVLYGAAGGQIAQQYGYEPIFGELFGVVQGGVVAPIVDRIPYLRNTFFLNPDTNVQTAYELATYGVLKTLEATGIGGFKKGSFYSETITFANQRALRQFTDVLADSDPEILAMVRDRVSLLTKYKDNLLKAGLSEEAFNTSLARLTGLAVLDAFDSTYSEAIGAGKVLTVEGLEQGQKTNLIRVKLTNELRDLMDRISVKTMDPEKGTDVSKFVAKMELGLKAELAKIEKVDKLLKSAAANQQAIIISSYVDSVGNVSTLGKQKLERDVQEVIDELYDYSGVKLGPDATAEQQYKEAISISYEIEKQVKQQADKLINLYNNSAKKDIFTEEALKLPRIQKLIAKETEAVDSAITISKMRKSIATEKVTKQIVSERLNKLLEVSVEARKAEIKRKGSVVYENLNTKYEGAKGDATNFFIEILDASIDSGRPAGELAQAGITASDLNKLKLSFGRTAAQVFDDFGIPREAIIPELKSGFNPKDDTHLLFHLLTDETSQFAEKARNIRVMIDFKDMYNITSALGRKAFDASSAKTGVPKGSMAAEYARLTNEANVIFDNFVTKVGTNEDGTPMYQAASTLRADIESAKEFYSQNVADILYDENSLFREWTQQTRGKKFTVIRPTGASYKKKSSTWINMDEIAKGDNQEFKDKLLEGFGDLQDGKYTIDIYKYKGLQSVLDFKVKEWIQQQRKAGKTIDEVNDGIKNLTDTFHVRQNDFLIDPEDYIGSNGYFSLAETKLRNKTVSDLSDDAESIITDALENQLSPIREQVKKERQNIESLLKLVGAEEGDIGQITTSESFFNITVGNEARGIQTLRRLKDQYKGTDESFDMAAKSIISKYIADAVYSKTERAILGVKNAGPIEVFDIDFKKLNEILGTNPVALKEIIGDEHYETLKDIAGYMTIYKARYTDDRVALTGVPRALSVESYISRMYSINRDVVSPRYVATETAVQQMRLNKIKMLQAIVQDDEVATLFGEMIQTGTPLNPEQNKRFFNSLVVAIARVQAQEELSEIPEMTKEKISEIRKTYDPQLKELGLQN